MRYFPILTGTPNRPARRLPAAADAKRLRP
jgi:hypothetical protein